MSEYFGVVDYIVFCLILLISVAIGIYYRFTGGKQSTVEEYVLADKSMGVFPVACSLLVTFMSAITLLGVSSENYTYGTQFVMINISYGIATPACTHFFLPVFYHLKASSVYEYLNLRFGRAAQLVASLTFSLQLLLYLGVVLYAPALALNVLTDMEVSYCIVLIGLVTTIYATIGGMKAVLINDVFQCMMMFAVLIMVVVKGCIEVGGVKKVFEISYEGDRLEFFNMNPDPTIRQTFWTQAVGGVFVYLSLYAVNQAQVQRLLTVKNLRGSQLSLWVQWPILTSLSLITSFSGLVLYAYYQKCDPYTSKRIGATDQLLPLFVLDTMGNMPGLPGFFVSGIFSGSLSTMSSALNSLATVTMQDYVKPLCQYLDRPLQHELLLTKVCAFVFGLLSIALGFVAGNLEGVLQAALSIFGIVGGPLLALFFLGMSTRFVGVKGAVSGLLVSLAFCFWISFGQPRPVTPYLPLSTEECPSTCKNCTSPRSDDSSEYMWLYRVSYMWYGLIGFLVCCIVAMVVSLVLREQKGKHIPDNLVFTLAKCREYYTPETVITANGVEGKGAIELNSLTRV